MLELDPRVSAEAELAECARRGLAVRSERGLAGKPGSRHWVRMTRASLPDEITVRGAVGG